MKTCLLLGREKEVRLPPPKPRVCALRDCGCGTWDKVARPHPHPFTSSLDNQHQAFLKQLVGAGAGVGCCSANTGYTHDPDLLIPGLN